MDLLEEHYDDYLAWLYRQSNSIVKRDTSVFYYDCTNFYFECEQADEDIVDEVTGEVLKGLRQYGVSKEHRPTPIVEMGLFMDHDGIPITIDSLKSFDRHQEGNLGLYNDYAYKVIEADKALDLGLYEEIALKNGKTV